MRSRKTLIILFLAAALIALVGKRGFRSADESLPQSSAGESIAEVHGDRGFKLGQLAFAPCELGQRDSSATTAAFCAPFRVPENWDHPDGRKIDLKLAIVRSDAQVSQRDLVVMLAGGPGQAATEVYPRASAGFSSLLKHRNLVLLDQRGTGTSHPLECKQSPSDVDTAAVSDIDLDQVRELTQKCLAEVAKDADPAQYTTS